MDGCVEDAFRISELLKHNWNGRKNMDVQLFTSEDTGKVGARKLLVEMGKMFRNNLELAVLYFAGHGYVDEVTGESYLVTYDGGENSISWGIPVSTILKMANDSNADSKLIVLDCCHSGSMGRISSQDAISQLAILGSGVTIMTASKEDEVALEYGAHGLFTSLLIDGLEGAAADIEGRVTPASLYTHIDQALATYEQRPLYKANVQTLVSLRRVEPRIGNEILNNLHREYFKNGPESIYKLGPEHEPDRGEFTEKYKDIEVDYVLKEPAYRKLQACAKQWLVVPVDQPHMWHAAMHETGCRLTALGRFYWMLGEKGRLSE